MEVLSIILVERKKAKQKIKLFNNWLYLVFTYGVPFYFCTLMTNKVHVFFSLLCSIQTLGTLIRTLADLLQL